MIVLHKPNPSLLEKYLRGQSAKDFTYPHVGASLGTPPRDYNLDHHRICLGSGLATFRAGCTALRSWKMFAMDWIEVFPKDLPLQVGNVVSITARFGPIYWVNCCRIVSTFAEDRRFGFAYGTLPDHAESGEERFSIEWLDDDGVWYDVLAFSRPRSKLAWLGYPFTRKVQKRFAEGSLAGMNLATQKNLSSRPEEINELT